MIKLCLFILAILTVVTGFSQSEKGRVYLKNGTILKGKYQYSEDGSKLRVTSAGNIWVFDSVEIDSVSNSNRNWLKSVGHQSVDSRYFFRAEVGILAGNSEDSQSAPLSVTGSINYKVIPKFAVGVGTGVEFLKESYLPVFINTEYKLRNSVSSPYFFLKGGYQIAIDKSNQMYYDVYPPWSSYWPLPEYGEQDMDTKGGILINPGVGFTQTFSSGFGMSVAFGYQYHRLRYKGSNDYELDIDYNRLTIKLGIIFR